MRIGFVGAGNIAQALARGFIAAGEQMGGSDISMVTIIRSCVMFCACENNTTGSVVTSHLLEYGLAIKLQSVVELIVY